MFHKWLASPQPLEPMRTVVYYCESNEDSEDSCYACCAEDESTEDIIKSEYNSNGAPIIEEEEPKTVLGAEKWEWICWAGQENPEPNKKTAINWTQKQVDYEDQNNPAYVPRRGDFFQHDLRRTNDRTPRPQKRNIRKHEGYWKHDKFNENKQAPKTREELITTYGFDIRACQNPDEIRLRPSTQQRYKSCHKMKFRIKRQRKQIKHSKYSGSAPQISAYKELQDYHNRQCPSRETPSDHGGCKDKQPAELAQHESPGPSSKPELRQEPNVGSSQQENRANLTVKKEVVDQRRPTPKASLARILSELQSVRLKRRSDRI
ncbi:protein CASC3-like [Eleutherodactylus coqui]|uniref:protein CASC3-like n=1 Tax=Eleutherodactylus coqui TaxID=57060 RepID=UPI0034620391